MRARLGALLCLLPLAAMADERVTIAPFVNTAGVLPLDRILIRNASPQALDIWIALDKGWERYALPAEASADIAATRARVALSTSETEPDPVADGAPPLPPERVPPKPAFENRFFYTTLDGGTRAMFCWSPRDDHWRVQVFGETHCS